MIRGLGDKGGKREKELIQPFTFILIHSLWHHLPKV